MMTGENVSPSQSVSIGERREMDWPTAILYRLDFQDGTYYFGSTTHSLKERLRGHRKIKRSRVGKRTKDGMDYSAQVIRDGTPKEILVAENEAIEATISDPKCLNARCWGVLIPGRKRSKKMRQYMKRLTKNEKPVLDLWNKGFTVKQIQDKLQIDKHAVRRWLNKNGIFPQKLINEKREKNKRKTIQLWNDGYTVQHISNLLGMQPSACHRYLKEAGFVRSNNRRDNNEVQLSWSM